MTAKILEKAKKVIGKLFIRSRESKYTCLTFLNINL